MRLVVRRIVYKNARAGEIARARRALSRLTARRGGAREAVVDRLAQAGVRDWHNRDRGDAGGIECAQMQKEIGGGLDQVAARGEVEPERGVLGAARGRRSEGEQRLARLNALRLKPQPRPRRIVPRE